MEVSSPRCCGLDVHKRSVTACLLLTAPGEPPRKAVRTCSTLTADLRALGDWLAAHGVTHAAMESTGVYWKPIWNLWEARFGLLLVNAAHVTAVPGRKTDVRDSEWLADLLRHGLLKPSFVPAQPQRELRELRELTRPRTSRVSPRTAEVNRLQKSLEGANLKLASVASDVTGLSARQMLEALIAGETDPAVLAELAELAKGRLRAKLPELERALTGRCRAHHRFLPVEHLAAIDELDAGIARLGEEIAARVDPFAAAVARLETIPGVGRATAEVLVAELGTDLSRFPSARHCASWAGLCPGNHERAGQQRSGRIRKGNQALRTALVVAAHGAARQSGTDLAAQYRRLAARRGTTRAAVAVAPSILVIAYRLLKDGTTYQDLGPDYFDERDRTGTRRRLVQRLERLGDEVTLEPRAA